MSNLKMKIKGNIPKVYFPTILLIIQNL